MIELYAIDTSINLSHFGHKGMKWYQHLFGDDKRVGKAGRAKNAGKKQTEETKEKDDILSDDERIKVVRSGDPKLVRKYAHQMNEDEINEAVGRVKINAALNDAKKDELVSQYDQLSTKIKLNNLMKEQEPSIWKTVDSITSNANKLVSSVDSVIDVYNGAKSTVDNIKGLRNKPKDTKESTKEESKESTKEESTKAKDTSNTSSTARDAVNAAKDILNAAKSAREESKSRTTANDVEGVGSSHKTSSETSTDDTPIDTTWKDVTPSSSSSNSTKGIPVYELATYSKKASSTKSSSVDYNQKMKNTLKGFEELAKKNKDITDKF